MKSYVLSVKEVKACHWRASITFKASEGVRETQGGCLFSDSDSHACFKSCSSMGWSSFSFNH